MPQHPDDHTWVALNDVEACIEAENEQLRRYVNLATQRLTGLHRQRDDLHAKLGITEVVIDTQPPRHLQAVRDDVA